MAAESIASLLHTLTSEEYVRSESSDNDGLEALITEYFTGNNDMTDNEKSKAETTEVFVDYCIQVKIAS